MPNDGKCALCGYRAPVTSFLEAAGNGDLVPEYIKLPQELQAPFYKYMALFKPASGRAMQNSKSIRLIREMVALVSTGYVSRKGKVDRPCTPSMWVRGIEKMLDQASGLELPMENHNYLRKVVYQLADQADAGAERQQHQQILTGAAHVHRDDPPPADDGLSQFERAYIAAHGSLPEPEPDKVAAAEQLVSDLARKLNAKK